TYFNAGKYYSGIIAPNVTSGIITNCYTAASTIIGAQYAGGIIAANLGCTISNCYSTSTGNSSKGQNYYGGISGINRSGEIVNCYTNQQVNRGGGVHKDDSDFKSGEVTYLLNEGKNDGTQVWFQDLSEGGDDYPTFVNTGSNAVQLSSDGKSYVNNIAHTHTLTKVDAVAATSTEHGHNEYWTCSGCGNWFADETGTTLTTIEELVTHYIEYVNGMGTCQVCNSFRYEVPPTDMQGTYLIGNTGQLIAFANMVNNGQDFRAANAKLISDIILNEGSFGTDGTFIATGSSEPSTPFSWPIIGVGTHSGNGYKGTFDGQGHTVSGLYVYDNTTGLASFVGMLEANGKIMNLGVINSYFEGSRVGGISGYTDGKSEIINCYSDIIGKGDYIGGIVGQGSECKGISNCYSTSELTCTVDFLSAGGIVGEKNSTFPITNCYTTCSTILGLTFNSFESACEAGVSVERFASGEIAYKLNGSTSEGNFVWYQKIGEGGDAYPSLTKAKDNTVYYVPGYLCDGVTADGEMYYNNNGERYVADHTEATDAAVAATCTETGLTEGKHCSICYTVLVEQVETEPLGHSWGEYHLDGDQTCTNDGHKTAECTREGCSEKNKIVATGTALGHAWGEYTLDGDQTCEGDGHKTAKCTREGCSEENKIVATGAALGHDWEDFFTVDAWEDCEHAGSKSIHCHRLGCDAHQNETVIPALGHLFTEYLSNGDATTEADGHKTAECDRGCGATDTVIDEGSRIIETPTGITNVESGHSHKAIKTIEDGRVVIIRNGVRYDITGRKM
ncbi:MAG: hypothetical protein KBT04_07320, partial [Bacteroidales bacterium]|nr:hypothetical protein [Candidatus Colimorpha onthohippi]